MQDDSAGGLALRVVAGATLFRFASLEPAAGSNPTRITHSKKAPLGRLLTLVGRAGFEPATN